MYFGIRRTGVGSCASDVIRYSVVTGIRPELQRKTTWLALGNYGGISSSLYFHRSSRAARSQTNGIKPVRHLL